MRSCGTPKTQFRTQNASSMPRLLPMLTFVWKIQANVPFPLGFSYICSPFSTGLCRFLWISWRSSRICPLGFEKCTCGAGCYLSCPSKSKANSSLKVKFRLQSIHLFLSVRTSLFCHLSADIHAFLIFSIQIPLASWAKVFRRVP